MKSKPVQPPEGYRLLHPGEWCRPRVDIYLSRGEWLPQAGPGLYHPNTMLPVARPIDPEVQSMLGAGVFFNGALLGVIATARESKSGWVFDLDNGHCIRDFRGCSGWEWKRETRYRVEPGSPPSQTTMQET